MRSVSIQRLLTLVVILVMPVAAYAQEATFTGSVTDSTGAVLPGVTITAVNEASGNTFTAVTDERGDFRLPVRVGTYRITSELSGFTTVNRTLQILIGQDGRRQRSDGAVNRAGNRHRHGRGAAGRYDDVDGRREYRSAADAAICPSTAGTGWT